MKPQLVCLRGGGIAKKRRRAPAPLISAIYEVDGVISRKIYQRDDHGSVILVAMIAADSACRGATAFALRPLTSRKAGAP